MYLSKRESFMLTALIFGLGLFVTVLIPRNLGNTVNTGSSAQVAPTPFGANSSTAAVTCAMCDLDGSGVVDNVDIDIIKRALIANPSDQRAQYYLTVCTPYSNPPTPVTSCPAGTGGTGGTGGSTTSGTAGSATPTISASLTGVAPTAGPTTNTTPGTSNSPSPNPTGGNSGLGDCNSAQGPGQLDGRTDLLDFEQLRQELSGEASTLHCDFDGNGSVDIIDFTDFFRRGFNS